MVTRITFERTFVRPANPGSVPFTLPQSERNERLKVASEVPLVDPGCQNPIRHVAALIGHCDVVITGDTLAMHIALERRAVIFFGPTSWPEIETYGRGEKIVPDMKCLSGYKTSCDCVPNCMDLISAEMVEQAVARQLRIARDAIGGP